MPDYTLTVADTAEARRAARQFWYAVYVDEMHKLPEAADHDRQEICDELESGSTVYCLVDGPSIVATLRRTNFGDVAADSPFHRQFRIDSLLQKFAPHEISYWSKLVVQPNCRDGTVMRRVVGHAYDQVRKEGQQFACLHAAPHLVPLYERLGFRALSDVSHSRGVGLLAPMVLVLEDVEHLAKVRSPFRKTAAELTSSQRGLEVFHWAFPEVSVDEKPSTTASWEDLAASLLPVDRAPPARRALTQQQLEELCDVGRRVRVQAGETIQDSREPSKHVVVILSGAVEVSLDVDDHHRPVSALGPGQLFGERSLFPDVSAVDRFTALTDVELLLVPAFDIWDRLMQSSFGQMALLLLRAASHRHWLALRDVHSRLPEVAT